MQKYDIHIHTYIRIYMNLHNYNKIKRWRYRDGNKSPETRFNMYTQSSETEQAFEITMTPAL